MSPVKKAGDCKEQEMPKWIYEPQYKHTGLGSSPIYTSSTASNAINYSMAALQACNEGAS